MLFLVSKINWTIIQSWIFVIPPQIKAEDSSLLQEERVDMDPPTPKEMKAASASSDAHPVPETEKSKMDTEPTEQLSTEKSIESPRVVHVESSAPSAQRISIESVKLRAEEDKKDGGVIQEADQLKDTDTVIDVEAPEERAPTDNDTETSVDETKSKTSSSKNNGASHAVQKTTKYGKITTIGLCFLLLALGAGAVVNFLVFNTTNTSVKSSFLNETGSSSSDLFPTSFPTRSPTKAPTQNPSASPTMSPTISGVPTISESPTNDPSRQPSNHPTMSESPTKRPTSQPSIYPTISTSPSTEPSNRPSTRPTMSESPTKGPTSQPSNHPTVVPSVAPSSGPTSRPSELPTVSDAPSNGPTIQPSTHPTLSGAPTTEPTRQPSIRPTMAPSDSPTLSQIPTNSPTKSPTRLPTRPPTNPPTVAFEVNFRSYLEDDVGIQTDSYNANQAITQMTEEARADGNGDKPMTPKLVQRYAMINMELALFGSTGNWGRFNQDECSWPGITCNGDEQVAVIERPGKGLQGSIPSEVGLLRALAHFDLSRNNLQGSLPEELYDAVSLQKIYLYQNRLSGTISDKIINLWSLTRFNLSSNRISGEFHIINFISLFPFSHEFTIDEIKVGFRLHCDLTAVGSTRFVSVELSNCDGKLCNSRLTFIIDVFF